MTKALFIWPAPLPEPERYVTSARDVLGMVDRAAAALYPDGAVEMTPDEAREAEHEMLGVVLDQLAARRPTPAPPPPPQPDIPVEGEAAGLRWGRAEAPDAAHVLRFAQVAPIDIPPWDPAVPVRIPLEQTPLIFRRRWFIGLGRGGVLLADGVDVDHVVTVLPIILRASRSATLPR